jgi:hypothetical protein
MKYYFTSLVLLLILSSITSCSSPNQTKKTETADEFSLSDDYYEFKGLSLKDYDIPCMIMLPDETANIGAATKPDITHIEGDFIWDISLGNNFNLHIEDYGDYTDLVDYKRKELSKQDIFKINYLVEEKDLLVYERKLIVKGSKNASPKVGIEHKSYHVYGQKTINGITYEFRSREEGYEQKRIISLMAKTIKSVEEIK